MSVAIDTEQTLSLSGDQGTAINEQVPRSQHFSLMSYLLCL